jgi:nucleoid DNA-binding protein
MNNDLSINKRILWRYINRKINRIIHHYHVFSVITILFDEMLKDLIRGKSIKISNFGTLSLKQMKPRKYFDVRFQQVMQSKGHKILRFKLAAPFRKKLVDHLDLDKTFKDD